MWSTASISNLCTALNTLITYGCSLVMEIASNNNKLSKSPRFFFFFPSNLGFTPKAGADAFVHKFAGLLNISTKRDDRSDRPPNLDGALPRHSIRENSKL